VALDLEVDKSGPIYIAIASMTSPRETFIYYNQLIDYLSKKLGRTILIKQKKTYGEVNELLKKGEVDFAFVCSGAYSELSENKEVDLLVAPVINGKTYYQAYIISRNTPEFNSFEDLKDKRFAFTDPLSHTGYMYPRYLLKKRATHERIFFSKTLYTYGHDISIQMVNRGALAGASVHGLIYDYIEDTAPERVENVRVLKKSEWFAMPPVVIPKQLNKELATLYRELFLNIHNDSLGGTILEKLKIEKFVIVEDSIYENVRKLKDDVENENN
jgi:phosphonate transport system substrate-binding protein